MKTIVVSGARSKIGKTTLSRALCALLPGAVHVKLGHGKPKPGMRNVFYPAGTPVERVLADNPAAAFLVIESNRILESYRPDLAIYLPADAPKPSAAAARGKAGTDPASGGGGAGRAPALGYAGGGRGDRAPGGVRSGRPAEARPDGAAGGRK